jgi:hypothetical protein
MTATLDTITNLCTLVCAWRWPSCCIGHPARSLQRRRVDRDRHLRARPITDPDYSVCLNAAQAQAITNCGTVCRNGGVSHGTYGVAYCVANRSVYWDYQFQGHPTQQYDCGDV